MRSNAEWDRKYYGGLVGFTCTKVEITEDEDGFGYWPRLIFERTVGDKHERLEVEVSQDPEGNGPGFLFGLPDPRQEGQ